MGKWQPAKTSMSPFPLSQLAFPFLAFLRSLQCLKVAPEQECGKGVPLSRNPPWEHHCALCPNCLPNKTSSQVHSEVMPSQIHEYDGGRTTLPSRGNHSYREA